MFSDIFINFLFVSVFVLLIQFVNQGIVQNIKYDYGRDFMKKFMFCVGIRKILQYNSSKDVILNDVYVLLEFCFK